VAKGFDGVHGGGTLGRIEAEDNSYERRDAEGEQWRPEGYDRPHSSKVTDEHWYQDSKKNSQQPAGAGENDGFDKELREDIAAFGTEGASDADLPRPFCDSGKHDVHDADAADQQ
jgi:hypothetical protein